MRLLTCYSRADRGNKGSLWAEVKKLLSEPRILSNKSIHSSCLCSFTPSLQFFLTYEQLKKINVWLTEWDGEEETSMSVRSGELRGPKIRTGWMWMDPWWNPWAWGEEYWCRPIYEACLIPVWATYCPKACGKCGRHSCLLLAHPNAMLSLTARLDLIGPLGIHVM